MRTNEIVQSVVDKIKTVLGKAEALLDGELTPESAEQVSQVLTEATSAGWVEGFRVWLEAHENHDPSLESDGKLYRFKLDSEKEFLTPAGIMKLSRRLYQPDAGGECLVPLDAAWGMEGEFATVEVREAVLFTVALVTPQETETLLEKCALFHPSQTAIKRIAGEMGQWLEGHEDEMLPPIRAAETPPPQTRVLCASLDGTNVLLNEPGEKRGRPRERPGDSGDSDDEPSTCYKNAMVASVSLYGAVPEGEKSPERLESRYVARMPQDRAPTLKRKFEQELIETEFKLDAAVVRIVLNDGARSLWKYIDDNPQFDDYEKLMDYHHSSEHLSKAAEAIFGKGSDAGQAWYEKYAGVLREAEDGAERLVRSLDYHRTARRLSPSRRKSLETERRFFMNNAHRMEYARFRRNGWPIGSGPVEAACKSVVKTRLCRSGMRWSRVGGQHILSLRTYVKSDRWDAMWDYYKETIRVAWRNWRT